MTDEAFVERRFELQPDREVRLRFFRPKQNPDESWQCDYRIDWPDRERRARGFGVDAVQALELAMEKAHLDLLVSPEREAGLLAWLGRRDLGLPLPANCKPEDFP